MIFLAFFGLGFLTKGPPALIPLLPIIVWHLWHKPETKLVGLKGLLAFALAGLSRYVHVELRNPTLVSYFLWPGSSGQDGIEGHLERFGLKRVVGLAICSALVLVTIKGITAYFPNRGSALRGS